MALQLRELTQRLQQTTAENKQLSNEINSLRNAVKVIPLCSATHVQTVVCKPGWPCSGTWLV